MSKYTNKMLNDLNVIKQFDTPSDAYFMEVDEESPPMCQKELASIVMSIYYLAMRTRPDVLFHVTSHFSLPASGMLEYRTCKR